MRCFNARERALQCGSEDATASGVARVAQLRVNCGAGDRLLTIAVARYARLKSSPRRRVCTYVESAAVQLLSSHDIVSVSVPRFRLPADCYDNVAVRQQRGDGKSVQPHTRSARTGVVESGEVDASAGCTEGTGEVAGGLILNGKSQRDFRILNTAPVTVDGIGGRWLRKWRWPLREGAGRVRNIRQLVEVAADDGDDARVRSGGNETIRSGSPSP